MDTYNSNKSRREFIKSMALAGSVSSALVGCTKKGPRGKELKLYGLGTLNIGSVARGVGKPQMGRGGWDDFSKVADAEIAFYDNKNDPGPVITQMVAGTAARDYHLGALQGGAEKDLVKRLIPWDTSKIPNWKTMWEWAKDISYTRVDGKQYGLPVVINADSIIYLPDEIKQISGYESGIIDSYAAVFDRRLRGKTAMEDAWINSVIFAAIFLRSSGQVSINKPGDLTETELKQVMEFLMEHKKAGQFRTFWRGWEQGVSLVASKEVIAMTGWEPIVYAARKQGIDARYAVPKEGYEGWSNDLLLHEGANNDALIELAHQFADWELGGYYGAELAAQSGYIVPNDTTEKWAAANLEGKARDDLTSKIANVRDKFKLKKGEQYWQNVRPENYRLYEEWWTKLRNL
ncbi:MAG: spermidine/putrescine transporter [Verrucomicrobiales bacterium]|nr:spermidine/putrescine transporter [Verrucomicrobiales bacterium]